MTRKLFLSQAVAWEPLVNQWYAVPYLVPPLTSALYLANSHLAIMKSYVRTPSFHAAAAANPALAGGPFIDYGGGRVDEVQALMDRTAAEQAPLLELAQAATALRRLLAAEARGYALEPLYARVPEPLRGYVELVYDLGGQPAARLMESLLYRSRYYDERRQSVAFHRVGGDVRPFVLSTPRLPDAQRLVLSLPFRSLALDRLAGMELAAEDPREVAAELELDADGYERFGTLLTDVPGGVGAAPAFAPGERLRVRYFGHACALIETARLSLLVDPFYSYAHADTARVPRFTVADLPARIDYLLITHAHQDHLILEMLLRLRRRVGCVVVPRTGAGALPDPSLKLLLQQAGFARVVELDDFEALEADGARILSIPFLGEHSDLDVRGKSGYCIQADGRSVMFLADSNNMEPALYAHVEREIGRVDLLFLGMECVGAPLSWLYGPLLGQPPERKLDQARRTQGSDCRRAVDLVRRFRPAQAHVYAMGQEPWIKHILPVQFAPDSTQMKESREFVQQCRSLGVESELLFGRKEIRV